MDKNTHRLQITLSESLYQQLKQAAEGQEISMSMLTNIALKDYIRKLKRKEKTDSTSKKPE